MGAPLSEAITLEPVRVDLGETEKFLLSMLVILCEFICIYILYCNKHIRRCLHRIYIYIYIYIYICYITYYTWFDSLLQLCSNKDIASATVIRVDLPFKPDSLVAFLALTTDTNVTTNTTTSSTTDADSTTDSNGNVSRSGALKNGNGHADETDYHIQIQSYILQCQKKLHYYLIPTYIHIVPSSLLTTGTTGGKSAGGGLGGGSAEGGGKSLQELALKYYQEQNTVGPRNATEAQIELIWREQVLVCVSCIVT